MFIVNSFFDFFSNNFGIIANLGVLYLLAGLITLFVLMRSWKKLHGSYADIQDTMSHMALLSIIGWPYVLIIWILSWRIFTWQFWLKELSISLPVHWWIKQ